jgi:hypothetical protein
VRHFVFTGFDVSPALCLRAPSGFCLVFTFFAGGVQRISSILGSLAVLSDSGKANLLGPSFFLFRDAVDLGEFLPRS